MIKLLTFDTKLEKTLTWFLKKTLSLINLFINSFSPPLHHNSFAWPAKFRDISLLLSDFFKLLIFNKPKGCITTQKDEKNIKC